MLDYDGILLRWQGEWEQDEQLIVVIMKDSAYRRHLTARLASAPMIPGEQATIYTEQQQALHRLRRHREIANALCADLAYWQQCSDPEVRIHTFPQR